MTKEVTSKMLANGLIKTFAGFFTEMVPSTKRDAQEGDTYNRFEFLLSQMLGTMHWKAGKLIEATNERDLPRAVTRALAAGREHDGTEIKELELARACDFVEKLKMQVAMLTEFQRVIVEDVWPNAVEAPFSRAPAQMPEHTPKTAAFDRLRALTQPVGGRNGAASTTQNSPDADHRSVN